ncbi:hypothetical protein GQ457_01G034730 [Hibiscus cannabinus]
MTQTSSSSVAESGSTSFPSSESASDVSTTQITSHKFNGHNYLQWSQTVYITDSSYDLWLRENSMVMSWLINSMTPDVGVNFLLYETAFEIWEAAKEMYSTSDNVAEQFDIGNIIHNLCQTEMSVTQYYNTLTSSDLDAVKGRIIAMKPLPSLREAFLKSERKIVKDCLAVKKAGKVSEIEIKEEGKWEWNIELRRELFSWEQNNWDAFMVTLNRASMGRAEVDHLISTGSSCGYYTAKDFCSSLVDHEHKTNDSWQLIWSNLPPSKVEIFVWRASLGRLATQDCLSTRGK